MFSLIIGATVGTGTLTKNLHKKEYYKKFVKELVRVPDPPRHIDKVTGKTHPWNIGIEKSILNEANGQIQDTDNILSSQVDAHGFLCDFRADGMLPTKKQEHIDRPYKIWPQKILRPIPHTELPVCGNCKQQHRCRKKPNKGFFSLFHSIPLLTKDGSTRWI